MYPLSIYFKELSYSWIKDGVEGDGKMGRPSEGISD